MPATTTYYPISPVAPRPNIPQVINICKATQVLSMVDLYRNRAWRGGSKVPDKRLFMLLCATGEILEWHYLNVPNADNIELMANYVWALIGEYQTRALAALGNGSGIIINPTTGNPINLIGYRVDFTIGQAGSLMFAGDTSLTIALPGFVRDTLDFFVSGVSDTIGDNTQVSITSIVWNPLFITINLNQGVLDGQRVEIRALRATAGTISGGGSTTPIPIPLQRGKFLTNDGDNLIWDDVWIEVSAADFEPDGKTYINTTLNGYYLGVEWINVPQWLNFETDEATLIDGGGFVVNLDGFNATDNPDWRFKVFKKSL